ncbi:MAG: DotU family type IV/VI secretion system protein [Treponema sp.]|jgi:type VI protein secretion system component VasF|nr:DotU family type IV/VI secretion system protein [Treponema sp.]
MSGITELERICNPVFLCVCKYWQLSGITNYIEKEKFLRDIKQCLGDAKKNAERDPRLAREYAWIEKPLVFFIDYMVKEGRFPFRQEWMELSRNYNELSGDEKFFDLLSETLDYPEFQNSAALFYIMLGLGFDGAYRFNRNYIEECMRLCMEKTVVDFDVYSEPIAAPPPKKHAFKRRNRLTVGAALIAGAVFMVICFIINLVSYSDATENYREILKRTADDSVPRQESVAVFEGNT